MVFLSFLWKSGSFLEKYFKGEISWSSLQGIPRSSRNTLQENQFTLTTAKPCMSKTLQTDTAYCALSTFLPVLICLHFGSLGFFSIYFFLDFIFLILHRL